MKRGKIESHFDKIEIASINENDYTSDDDNLSNK